jgi:hypothetical protein
LPRERREPEKNPAQPGAVFAGKFKASHDTFIHYDQALDNWVGVFGSCRASAFLVRETRPFTLGALLACRVPS